jgi:hypothetical protein
MLMFGRLELFIDSITKLKKQQRNERVNLSRDNLPAAGDVKSHNRAAG